MAEDKIWSANNLGGGGLNSDDDLQATDKTAFPSSDYTYSLNFRDGGRGEAYSGGKGDIPGNIIIADQVLPGGRNKCIGSYEDQYTPSIIFFNWNENGDHGIYQFFPFQYGGVYGKVIKLMETETLNFQEHWTITGVNLVENKLLYWVQGFENVDGGIEGNPPRKINVIKANDSGKQRTYQIIFDHDVFEIAGAITGKLIINIDEVPVEFLISMPQDSYLDFLKALAEAINSSIPETLFAEACDCGLDITILTPGEHIIDGSFSTTDADDVVTTQPSMFIAVNFYRLPILDDYLQRIKYPPLKEPTFIYMSNPDTKQNNLVGEYFQFAVRYRYDDGEKSVKGPISGIAYQPLPCGVDDSLSPYNFIRVDFTADRLKDVGVSNILTGADLLMRNGNNGVWVLVKTFDRCDLDVTTQSFDFYNDGNYATLDDTINDTQHDIPLISMTQEFVANRGFIEGGLESYDNIECPEGRLGLSYTPEDNCEDEELATITGRIYIHNPFAPSAPYALYQPIYDAGSGPVFGGMPPALFVDNAGTNYAQRLYLRGFRIYSAGTDFNTLSVQNLAGLPVTGGVGNVYDADSSGKRDDIRTQMALGNVYSEFTLQVKAGTHIIRIASHLSQPLDDGSAMDSNAPYSVWQKTSTYVDSMGATNLAEIIVTVAPGETLNIADTVIMDLKDVDVTFSHAFSGYLLDGEADLTLTQEELFPSPRMTRQVVVPTVAGGTDTYCGYNNQFRTDHNGFIFGARFGSVLPDADDVNLDATSQLGISIKNIAAQFYSGTIGNLEVGTCTLVTVLSVANEHKAFVIFNRNIDVSNYCRTNIIGNIVNSDGGPAIGIQVLFGGTGVIATTDGSGGYSLLVYVDTFNNQRNNYLIVRAIAACCADYPDVDKFFIIIGQFVEDADYSINFPFTAPDWIVDILGLSVYERLKKRNKIILGIVYSDEEGRCGKVIHWKDWEAYIPFDTEPEGNEGIALLQWFINHAPPSWAKRYHIVRMINPIYERYEQFIIGEVTYVSHVNTADDETATTTYAAGDATAIYISMETFIFYAEENTDSQVIFIPQVGDRITFKLKEDGTLFEGFFDYRILSHRGDGAAATPLEIVIKFTTELPELFPGMLVELWTPKLVTETAPYFEIMESHPILDIGGIRVHGAGFDGQNQVLGFQPATGFLQRGDTWVYKRNMLTKDTTVDPDDKDYFLRQVESQYINDWDRIGDGTTSFQMQIGRPHVEDKEWAQIFQRTRIRWCGTYVSVGNTIVNDYSAFRALEYKDIETEYGTCMRLVRVGELAELMSIHKYKLQPLYVGFKELVDLTGQTIVGKSSDVIDVAQSLVIKAGTSSPESIFVEGNYIYGWSTYFGGWWRYALNGVEIISNTTPFKIQKIANAKADQLRVLDPKYIKVHGAFHRDKKEAIWAVEKVDIGPIDGIGVSEGIPTIDVHLVIPAITIAFNESRNRWEGYYSYEPESMTALGTSLYTFKDGFIWLHEKNPVFNNFYGTQFYPEITFARAMDPRKEKLFYSMRITPAIGQWSAPSIKVLPSEINPNGMESRLSPNRFKTFKASSWADILRDFTDPNYTNQLEALFKARPLMGRVLLITLKNNSTEGVYLNEVNVSSSESNQTL